MLHWMPRWIFWANSLPQIGNLTLSFVFQLRNCSFLRKKNIQRYFFKQAQVKRLKASHHFGRLVSLFHTVWMESSVSDGQIDGVQQRRPKASHLHHWVRCCTPPESGEPGSLGRRRKREWKKEAKTHHVGGPTSPSLKNRAHMQGYPWEVRDGLE